MTPNINYFNLIMENDKANVSEDGEPSPKRLKRLIVNRPNFFVAVQISNPGIHREVNVLQKFITAKKPLFKSALINLITLHITLCTLHLPRNGDIKRAKSALRTLETNMKEMLLKDPICLKFKGIGSFKNEVIFAKIESDEHLTRIKGLHMNLVQALEDEGLMVTDKFEPHLTIMKMSKDRNLRKKKIFKIPKDLYEERNEMMFGDQTVNGVQLLKMAHRPAHEYYRCYHHFDLGFDSDQIEDHQNCCGVKSVLPTSLIEVDSDDETEEMFYEAKETLEEIMAIEELETKQARKYLKKVEFDKEVEMEFSTKTSSGEVVEVYSSKINAKRLKVQNKRKRRRKSKICRDGVNIESSELKIKSLEMEESEDLGLKFLMNEIEVEDVKLCDNCSEVENVEDEDIQVQDGNVDVDIHATQSTNPDDEYLTCEEIVVDEEAELNADESFKVDLKVKREMNCDEGMNAYDSSLNTEASTSQDVIMESISEVQIEKHDTELKETTEGVHLYVAEIEGESNVKKLEDKNAKSMGEDLNVAEIERDSDVKILEDRDKNTEHPEMKDVEKE